MAALQVKPSSAVYNRFGTLQCQFVLCTLDDDKLLVNPNCACKNILEFIRERCDCDKNALVDLCDENGRVKYLHVQPEMDIAADIVQNKATYIPLVVEKNEDQTIKKFRPLLQNCNTVYPTLKKQLREQCSKSDSMKYTSTRFDNIGAPKGKGNKSVLDLSKGKKVGIAKKRA